ncbi:MAG: zf-HC2 domain-containing protein [Firmicutes bacterium]|nr:zf-HC2 domain-containing protein [Bacillota bacterium]
MQYPCDTVKDLLPLCHDNACSDSSRRIVEEHLSECESCKAASERLGGGTRNRKNRKPVAAGICAAGGLAVPVLISLVINLVTAHALNWFFLVLTAMTTIALPVAVPFIAARRRWLYAVTSAFASWNLFLWACARYGHGGWFAAASLSSMLVLTSVFAPLVLRSLRLKKPFSRSKGLITMIIDTALLYALIVACGKYGNPETYWKPALLITTACALFAWLLFAVIRYAKFNGLIKAGVCVISGGLFACLFQLFSVKFFLFFFLAGCAAGGIFLITGIQKHRREAGKGEPGDVAQGELKQQGTAFFVPCCESNFWNRI